jgi:hypothetical protein
MVCYERVGSPVWVKKKFAVRPVFLVTLQCRSYFALDQPWHGTLFTHPCLRWLRRRHRRREAHASDVHHQHLAAPAPCSITPCAHNVRSNGLTNPSLCNTLLSARLERLGHNVPPTRPPAPLRLKQLQDPLLGACAPSSAFAPGGAKPVATRPDDDSDGEQEDEDGTPAVLSFSNNLPVSYNPASLIPIPTIQVHLRGGASQLGNNYEFIQVYSITECQTLRISHNDHCGGAASR